MGDALLEHHIRECVDDSLSNRRTRGASWMRRGHRSRLLGAVSLLVLAVRGVIDLSLEQLCAMSCIFSQISESLSKSSLIKSKFEPYVSYISGVIRVLRAVPETSFWRSVRSSFPNNTYIHTLHYIALHCITLQCNTTKLQYIALHCIALHYTI